MLEQAVPFNPQKGGTIPNLCLDNVCKGYGIADKFDSAWEAWLNTQQHTDPVPEGLDVPLFYSYIATIDGVTQNWGHINVRLANGTVWSDGNIYPSIEAYTAHHYPKYVGWGESINDITILKKGTEEMPLTPDQVNRAYLMVNQPSDSNDWAYYKFKAGELIDNLWNAYGKTRYEAEVAAENAPKPIPEPTPPVPATANSPAPSIPTVVHSPIPPNPVSQKSQGFLAWLKRVLTGK